MSEVEGQLEHSFGREKQGYTCGTLLVDHATGKIFNFCQISNDATETVVSKCKLEHMESSEGIKNKKYHTDNSMFASEEFQSNCGRKGQKLDFSGVGAQHQNCVAECSITTVAS